MASIHEKSSCCKARVVKYGGRRRQCTSCGVTWRVWQRTPGRRKHRVDKKLLSTFLNGHIVSIQRESKRRNINESKLRRRLTLAAEKYIKEQCDLAIPLNAKADAIVKRIQHEWWTVYFTALKDTDTDKAALLQPIVMRGRESYRGWQLVFNRLPDHIYSSIAAVVCDGHRGIVYYAKAVGWRIQRCHAHLLFSISGRRSQSKWSRHRNEGRELYRLVKIALTTRDQDKFLSTRDMVEVMGWKTSSRKLRQIISGFITNAEDYRTYLAYPGLNLPTTNNSMESFISQFQEICHRARGFSTARSLARWVTAFTKHKKIITCNGFHQPN